MLDTAERLTGVYRGIVADRNDPEGLLRVRVRVTSLLGDQETDWAWPSVPALGGAQAPNVGDPIWIIFEEGDIDRPVYLGTWAPNQTPVAPVSTTPYIISGGTNVYAVTTAIAFATEITGDTSPRMTLTGDGTLRWGSGHAATDTAFGRTGVATLGLTGSLTVSSAVNAASLYASGALTAASATITGALTAASGAISGSLSAGATTLTGSLSGTSATFSSTLSAASLSLGSPLPISSGGTGSATQNFVDLTTAQTIGGVKSWTSPLREADGTATAPSYSFTSEVGLGLYRVAAGVLGLQVPGGGWISGRRPDGSEFFKVQQDGTIVGYNAASFAGKVTVSAGGIDLSGSPSGYTGGELRFASAAGDAGISTLTTGTQNMLFDHRGTGNTGAWQWRNGTAAGIVRMTLSANGDISLAGGTGLGISISSGGVSGRVIYQDTSFLYMGAVDAARDVVVRSQGADKLTVNTNGLSVTNPGNQWGFYATGATDSIGLRVSSTGAGGREYGIYSTAASNGWGQGLLAIYDHTAGQVRMTLNPANSGTWSWYGNDHMFGRGVFGANAGRVHMGDLGTTDAYIVAENGTGVANSMHLRAGSQFLFENSSGTAQVYFDASGGIHQNNGVTSIYATFAEGNGPYTIRIGEIYGDGGLYKATGHMHFDLGGASGSEFRWSYGGNTRMTLSDTGNVTLLNGGLYGPIKAVNWAGNQTSTVTLASNAWNFLSGNVTITKQQAASSRLMIIVTFSCYATAIGQFNFGVGISTGTVSSGTVWIVGAINSINAHQTYVATLFSSALAAGTYNLRLAVDPTTATLNVNADDYATITVMEVTG